MTGSTSFNMFNERDVNSTVVTLIVCVILDLIEVTPCLCLVPFGISTKGTSNIGDLVLPS